MASRFVYLFTSSVVNLSELIALRDDLRQLTTILYFHENDLAYPKQNDKDNERDFQFGYNQILSALVADCCLFNSHYNRQSFLERIGPFLHRIPSPKPDVHVIREAIEKKSRVVHYPLDQALLPVRVKPCSQRSTKVLRMACLCVHCRSRSRERRERVRCASFGHIDGNTIKILKRSSRSLLNSTRSMP